MTAKNASITTTPVTKAKCTSDNRRPTMTTPATLSRVLRASRQPRIGNDAQTARRRGNCGSPPKEQRTSLELLQRELLEVRQETGCRKNAERRARVGERPCSRSAHRIRGRVAGADSQLERDGWALCTWRSPRWRDPSAADGQPPHLLQGGVDFVQPTPSPHSSDRDPRTRCVMTKTGIQHCYFHQLVP